MPLGLTGETGLRYHEKSQAHAPRRPSAARPVSSEPANGVSPAAFVVLNDTFAELSVGCNRKDQQEPGFFKKPGFFSLRKTQSHYTH